MNPANCLLPVAIVGIPILWLSVEHALERQRETARRICFEFDLSLAKRRYRERTGCDEAETAQVEQEFRRFFLLLAENPGTQLGLHNGQIDDFWHELICCTALYRGYCVEVAGRFIHHDPQGGSGDGYNITWWAYYDRFLEAPDARFWPARAPRTAGCRASDRQWLGSGMWRRFVLWRRRWRRQWVLRGRMWRKLRDFVTHIATISVGRKRCAVTLTRPLDVQAGRFAGHPQGVSSSILLLGQLLTSLVMTSAR